MQHDPAQTLERGQYHIHISVRIKNEQCRCPRHQKALHLLDKVSWDAGFGRVSRAAGTADDSADGGTYDRRSHHQAGEKANGAAAKDVANARERFPIQCVRPMA